MKDNTKCPNCGKYTRVSNNRNAWICENCLTPFYCDETDVFGKNKIIEEDSDFIIRDNVLLKYKGNETTVHIPENVHTIGNMAFMNCTELSSVYMSNAVRTIEKNAFYGCIRLVEVYLSTNLNYIGDNAFDGCISLVSVDIPASVCMSGRAKIGFNAFLGCTSLMNIRINDRVRSVNDHIFDNCNENVFFEWENLNNNINCCDVIHNRLVKKKCIHCGGDLTGFFTKKCTTCNK